MAWDGRVCSVRLAKDDPLDDISLDRFSDDLNATLVHILKVQNDRDDAYHDTVRIMGIEFEFVRREPF